MEENSRDNISEETDIDISQHAGMLLSRPSISSTTTIAPIVSSSVLNEEHDMEQRQQQQTQDTKVLVDIQEEQLEELEEQEEQEPVRSSQKLDPEAGESADQFHQRILGKVTHKQLRELLGRKDPPQNAFWSEFRRFMFDQLDIKEMTITTAIRTLGQTYHLPLEGQQIERILEDFAKVYVQKNPKIFKTWEHAFFLSWMIFMINTMYKRGKHDAVDPKTLMEQFKSIPVIGPHINPVFLKCVQKELKHRPIEGLDVGVDMIYEYRETNIQCSQESFDSGVTSHTKSESVTRNSFIDYEFLSQQFPGLFYERGQHPESLKESVKNRDRLHLRHFANSKCQFLFSCDEIVKLNNIDPNEAINPGHSMFASVVGNFTSIAKSALDSFSSHQPNYLDRDRPKEAHTRRFSMASVRRRSHTMMEKFTTTKPRIFPFKINDSTFDLTNLFASTSFLSPQFLLALSYRSLNMSPPTDTLKHLSDELTVKMNIQKSDNPFCLFIETKTFAHFLVKWKDNSEYLAMSDQLLVVGPILKKNLISASSLNNSKDWMGVYSALVLPKTGDNDSAPLLPELWHFDEQKSLQLEKNILLKFEKKNAEFCTNLEEDINVMLHDSQVIAKPPLMPASGEKLFPNPSKIESMTNKIAFIDKSMQKYVDTFNLAYPHKFPAPTNNKSHFPAEEYEKPHRRLSVYMAYLNRRATLPSVDTESEEDFVRSILHGVDTTHTVTCTQSGKTETTTYPSLMSFQWKSHINLASAISTIISDLRDIVKLPNISGMWCGFVEMIKNYYIDAIRNVRISDTISFPSSIYWLDDIPREEYKAFYDTFEKSVGQFAEDAMFFACIKPVLTPEIAETIRKIFNVSPDPSSVNQSDEVKLKIVKAMLRWLLLAYETRKQDMKRKVEECTRYLNQLEYALLVAVDQESLVDGSSHVADYVLDAGAAHRRGYLAARNAEDLADSVSVMSISSRRHSKTSMEKNIEVDIKYFEREIEWIRIEYQRWSEYVNVLDLLINAIEVDE